MILEHPNVLDAAVIGIPHDVWGQIPKAFVVKRKGASLTEEEVVNFLHGNDNMTNLLIHGALLTFQLD